MRDPWEGRTAAGVIRTGAAAERIPGAFRVVLADTAAAVSAAAPSSSWYLYGSVATRQAEIGRSDVDLLGIGLAGDRAQIVSADLSERFADRCRAVAVAVGAAAPDDFVGANDEAYGNRVFLRHYCVLASGTGAHRPDHDFPADPRAARGFNGDIVRHRDRWRSELPTTTDVGALATRIARKSLLALAGLLSVHDRIWTTDRAMAVTRWSEIEPERAAGLETLDVWTGGAPTVDRDEIARALDELVDPLARDIGLWPEP